MSNILPIEEENDIVGQRDERFQFSRASRLLSHLVPAKRTAPLVRPAEGYCRHDT